MEVEMHFRQPTQPEREVIQKLLTATFPGKDAISKQLESCLVKRIDGEGSLELKPNDLVKPAKVEKRIPVEAQGRDNDGIYVHFLLHVNEGVVKELEIYKDDGSPIKQMPQPDHLQVIVLPR
jgi:hypothetical protein